MGRAALHRLGPALLAFVLLTGRTPGAPLPAHAPSLSVHEESYGIATRGTRRESIQSLELRLVSRSPGTSYQVQCFFLRKGEEGGAPVVDDTVIFGATDPHASYIVAAKPIRIPGGGKGKTRPVPAKDPRGGFVVRVLSNGEVLREQFSTHALETELRSDPRILEKASRGKSARHAEAEELRKR